MSIESVSNAMVQAAKSEQTRAETENEPGTSVSCIESVSDCGVLQSGHDLSTVDDCPAPCTRLPREDNDLVGCRVELLFNTSRMPYCL